jgi:hypothetical protein
MAAKTGQSVKSVSIKYALLNDFVFTFGIVRRREGVARAVVDMDYVASNELGNLVRLGFVLDVYFTYVIRSVQHITIHVQRTLDDVRDSWAKVVCGDGLAAANESDGCQ